MIFPLTTSGDDHDAAEILFGIVFRASGTHHLQEARVRDGPVHGLPQHIRREMGLSEDLARLIVHDLKPPGSIDDEHAFAHGL